jgi:excisionase family DNA binding protein
VVTSCDHYIRRAFQAVLPPVVPPFPFSHFWKGEGRKIGFFKWMTKERKNDGWYTCCSGGASVLIRGWWLHSWGKFLELYRWVFRKPYNRNSVRIMIKSGNPTMAEKNRPSKRLYSIPEAAVYLGRTDWAIREMLWAGKIPCIRDGRRVLLDVNDMDRWIEKQKTTFSFWSFPRFVLGSIITRKCEPDVAGLCFKSMEKGGVLKAVPTAGKDKV